ncbi:MAG: ceramidase [Bacteroidetes bacterium]|nr:ceramidase [Bacteroidota bacterium]
MINKNFREKLKQHFYLLNHSRNAFFHPFLIAVVISFSLWGIYEAFKYVDVWGSWLGAGGNSAHFCELNRWDMLIVQPSNTWSNMGYLIVGLVLISIGLKDHYFKERKQLNNLIARHPAFTILIGVAMIHLFIGSFFYHASMTLAFQKMDITGIYAVIIALFTYNAFKAFPFIKIGNKTQSSHTILISLGIALNTIFFIEIWKWNVNIVFPVLILSLLALNIINMKRHIILNMYKKYLFSSLATMFVGITIWILDRSNVMCMPESIFQGHALWHLLTATSVLFIYFYYRSEELDLEKLEAYAS